jgi:hypothetical protein
MDECTEAIPVTPRSPFAPWPNGIRSPTDAWAHQVTRLSGDDVEFDATELLLIALQRAGHISRTDAVLLHADYLTQAEPFDDFEARAICATSPLRKTRDRQAP